MYLSIDTHAYFFIDPMLCILRCILLFLFSYSLEVKEQLGLHASSLPLTEGSTLSLRKEESVPYLGYRSCDEIRSHVL